MIAPWLETALGWFVLFLWTSVAIGLMLHLTRGRGGPPWIGR